MKKSKAFVGALALPLTLASSVAWAEASTNNVWVRVEDKCPAVPGKALGVGADFLITFAATAVGSAIDIAANYLATDRVFVRSTIVPMNGAFKVTAADPVATEFNARFVLINVGPKPLPELPIDSESDRYKASPVVVGLCFENAPTDPGNSAITAYVRHWKYAHFVDPTNHWFRDPERQVTLEVEMKTPEPASLLKLTLTTTADESTIARAPTWPDERMPWMKRPTMSYPSGAKPAAQEVFGPYNLSVTLTEIAKPSWLGRTFAATLTAQKGDIQDYVKQKLKEELDSGEKAKARLAKTTAAGAALTAYDTAYTEASDAWATYRQTNLPKDRTLVVLKLALSRQQEIVTREAFDAAGMTFQAYPALPNP